MSAIDFDAELNPAQRRAVEARDGAFLVIAGAGSGKTRTLVYRVANLVLQGVAPEAIVLLTFTRRAAQEMLRRAAGLLDERCRRVAGGTFHSFAHHVLRRHGRHLGFDSFTVLDRSDAADLVGILRSEGGYDRKGRRFARKDTILDLLSKHVNTGRSLEELVEATCPQFLEDLDDLRKLRSVYAERKRRQQVMDYDDLLVYLRDLLRDHDGVRAQVAGACRYLMVDEYQDTNRLQAHISALLAAVHGNVMVVGDDAQSIYSFRGSDVRNILGFREIFPGAETFLLEQNYRSTQPILDLGNAVLAEAAEKIDKRLFTELPGDRRPALVRATDDFDQARFICDRVLELREEGVPLSEIAVLSRAAWHTNSLELELRNRNIPFQKFGGIKFVEAAHVKDLCALLRLTVNPLDSGAWFRILQFFDGIGARTAQRLGQAVVEAAGSLAPLTDPSMAKRRYFRDLQILSALLATVSRDQLALPERMEVLIRYYRDLMPKKYDDALRRENDLEAIATIAGRYTSAEDFLSDLALDPPSFSRPGEEPDPEDEWMTVSTVHSAKGLEWHSVFVVNLNSGHFPSRMSLRDPDDLEEERRLFYVAITRAKQHLYLMRPELVTSRWSSTGDVPELSPFLEQLPELSDLVETDVFTPGLPELEPEEALPGSAPQVDPEVLARINSYFR